MNFECLSAGIRDGRGCVFFGDSGNGDRAGPFAASLFAGGAACGGAVVFVGAIGSRAGAGALCAGPVGAHGRLLSRDSGVGGGVDVYKMHCDSAGLQRNCTGLAD